MAFHFLKPVSLYDVLCVLRLGFGDILLFQLLSESHENSTNGFALGKLLDVRTICSKASKGERAARVERILNEIWEKNHKSKEKDLNYLTTDIAILQIRRTLTLLLSSIS